MLETPNVFSFGGITFSGFGSEEEAKALMPEILDELELSGYDTSRLPPWQRMGAENKEF